MICPRCGAWIDEGEPYCPECTWGGGDEYESYQEDNTYTPSYTQSNTNSHTTHTQTINNDTGRPETKQETNDNGTNPFACCCGGIIILCILGTIMQFLGL